MDSFSERELSLEVIMPLIKERLAAGQSVKFVPKGVSMLPMLRQGVDSVLITRASKPLKRYDLPLYQRADGTFVLHRVVGFKDGYLCIGDNQYTRFEKVEQSQIVAVVSKFYRGEKKHSVEETGYKIYCRVWHHSRFLRRVMRALKVRFVRLFKS